MRLRLFTRGSGSEIARRLKQRDRSAWEQLVGQEYIHVFHLHLRLTSDRDIAADLTQETFAAAYASIETFRGQCKPSTWLYGVALNCNRAWQRARGRHELEDELPDDLPDPDPTAEELAILRERRQRLYEAVQRLPDMYRRTVALRYFSGLAAAEVAALEGVDEGTVRWRCHQALRKLWAILRPIIGEENHGERGQHGRLRLAP